MNRALVLGLLVFGFNIPATAQAPTETGLVSALQPLSFLIGDWDADPGQSGETGAFSFKSAVQGHAIVRTNYANYPASAGKPPSRHDDLMVIAVENKSLHADYFDSEGHIIRYHVQSPSSGQVTFVSEARSNEPRYRLRYAVNPDGTLSGRFDIAAPGKPDAFNPYLTWTARRSR